MELNAYTENVSKLFSVQKKYVVPRFQRPYSWTKEQIKEFWEDIAFNIKFSQNLEYANEEYFIGTIVLVGDDSSTSLQIVDGQQRLTTITIFLSALARRFREINKIAISDSLYNNYVVGIDDNGEKYFKLENENPKPFLQEMIQTLIIEEKIRPDSEEEKNLQSSYNDIFTFLSRENIASYLQIPEGIQIDDSTYCEFLKSIRDQLTKYIKIIRITVKEEDEAYTIFETLNARGINLTFVDLIKNTLLKSLRKQFPTDQPRDKWTSIRKNLQSRDGVGNMETYVRHWWISKYTLVSEAKLYQQFKKEFQKGNIKPNDFITELQSESLMYLKICSPLSQDFQQQEERQIYHSLIALKNFGVSQQRPFLLSLFRSRNNKIVRLSDIKDILLFLEEFHFVFNAICSQRPSGIEQTYSKASKELNLATDKRAAKKALKNLKLQLTKRIPELSLFQDKFKELQFLNNYTKQKKIIQYIFKKFEQAKMTSNELAIGSFTLEHISNQSSDMPKEIIGSIGNLLPLSKELNEKCDSKTFLEKKIIYNESELCLPKEIANSSVPNWTSNDIEKRTDELAKQMYQDILNLHS